MNGTETRPAGRWWRLALLLLPVAVLLVHRPTFDSYLFDDDVGWVLDGRVLSLSYIFGIKGHSHFYRPLVGLHFVILAGWLKSSAHVLHLVNVAWHILNALLVFALARGLGLRAAAAFSAALLMAVLTRSAESVAWISGISAVLLTTFFLLCLVLHLRATRTGSRLDRILALACFTAALLTHEAGVTLLPVLLLLEWTLGPAAPGQRRTQARELALRFLPHACLTSGYLAVSYLVNRSNYVVTEGHYELGWHVLDNLARYLVSLYVGRPDPVSRILTVCAVLAGLVFGRPVLRFSLAFMLVTLLPYCFFTWGLTGRYLYLPGVGFALALGSLVPDLERASATWRRVVTAVVVAIVAGRFAVFAFKTARDFSVRTRPYSLYVERSRARHPSLPTGAVIEVPAPADDEPGAGILENLLRVAYDDPTLRVVVAQRPTRTR